MSSQSNLRSIPFSITQPQQSCRLLELPPELLELLSSGRPPTLYFKSATPSLLDADSRAADAAEHLHLCSPSRSYKVRQVSTSNSVYVVQSLRLPESDHEEDSEKADRRDADLLSNPVGITVVSQVGSSLELQPVTIDIEAALRLALPRYEPNEYGDFDRSLLKQVQMSDILANIPAPDGLIEKALDRLCIFPPCYIPTETVLLQVWRGLMEFQRDYGVDITQSFDPGHAASKIDMHGEIPKKLLCTTFEVLELTEHRGENTIKLHPQRTTEWVGRLVFKAQQQNRASEPRSAPGVVVVTDLADFEEAWKASDTTPQNWRQFCDMALFQNQVSEVSAANKNDSKPSKRKWHDRAKEQRSSGVKR